MGKCCRTRLSNGNVSVKSVARQVKKPTIDLGACTECGGCIEIAPDIFRFNDAVGYVEVCELGFYDVGSVEEAMKNCPEDCIEWEYD